MTAGQTLQDAEKHHNRNQASTFSFSPFTFMAHCEIPRTATESSNKRKMFPNLLWLQQCKLLSILNTHTAIQIKLLTSCPQNEGGFWRERESIRKLVHSVLSFSFLIVRPTLQNTKTEYYRIIVSLKKKNTDTTSATYQWQVCLLIQRRQPM